MIKSRPHSRRHHLTILAAVSAAALAITGCANTSGAADLTTGDPHAPEVTSVSAAGILGPGTAALWAANESGIAAEYGIDVEPFWVDNSSVSVTSVVSGEATVSIASYFSVIDAINQQLPLAIVAESYASSTGPSMLVTMPDSGITSIADLPGHTVNVISLNSSHAVKLKDQLMELGLDPDSVDWVELPYGEVPAALEQGTVDASSAVATALQTARDELGATVVFDYGDEPYTGMAESGFFMSTEFIAANPNTTAALQCTLTRSTQALIDDSDLYDRYLTEVLGMGPTGIAADEQVDYRPQLRTDSIQRNADLYRETGYLDEPFDFSQHIVSIPENC